MTSPIDSAGNSAWRSSLREAAKQNPTMANTLYGTFAGAIEPYVLGQLQYNLKVLSQRSADARMPLSALLTRGAPVQSFNMAVNSAAIFGCKSLFIKAVYGRPEEKLSSQQQAAASIAGGAGAGVFAQVFERVMTVQAAQASEGMRGDLRDALVHCWNRGGFFPGVTMTIARDSIYGATCSHFGPKAQREFRALLADHISNPQLLTLTSMVATAGTVGLLTAATTHYFDAVGGRQRDTGESLRQACRNVTLRSVVSSFPFRASRIMTATTVIGATADWIKQRVEEAPTEE